MNTNEFPTNYDKSSCLATTHLNKGDQVFVRNNPDTTGVTLEGAWWCSFSGYLTSADEQL